MATTYVDVLMQVRAEVGQGPLAGGRIYTFEAGTTTPLATYQDIAGFIANTNPVVLDAAGMATIRHTDGVAYKWVVTDAYGSELWTRDNILVGVAGTGVVSTGEYRVHLSYNGTPGNGGWLGGHIFVDPVTFPAGFVGSRGSVRTYPSSSYVVAVRKGETDVGTATIATDGTFTFATAEGAAVSFAINEQMDFYGPVTAGTAADFVLTLPGIAS